MKYLYKIIFFYKLKLLILIYKLKILLQVTNDIYENKTDVI
jgi:hypothetical protein